MKWIFSPLEAQMSWKQKYISCAWMPLFRKWAKTESQSTISKVVPPITVHLAPSSSLSLYPQCLVFHRSLKEALPSLFQGKDRGLNSLFSGYWRWAPQQILWKAVPERKQPHSQSLLAGQCHMALILSKLSLDQTEHPWGTLVHGKQVGMTMERINTVV